VANRFHDFFILACTLASTLHVHGRTGGYTRMDMSFRGVLCVSDTLHDHDGYEDSGESSACFPDLVQDVPGRSLAVVK